MNVQTVLCCVVSREGDPCHHDVGVQSTGHLGNITGMAPDTNEKTEPGDVEILAETHSEPGHVGQEFELLLGACTSSWTPCSKYVELHAKHYSPH